MRIDTARKGRLFFLIVFTSVFIFMINTGCYMKNKEIIQRFETVTGLHFPESGKVHKSGNSYLDRSIFGPAEGELYVIVKTDKKYVQSLLSQSPPLNKKWQKGPVPGEYGLFITFGYKNDGYGKGTYAGSDILVDVLSSPDNYYCAEGQNKKPGGFYTNGKIIIVDPETNMLWISKWDS